MTPFWRSVWLRASSSNSDVLESSPRRCNWRCHSPRHGQLHGLVKGGWSQVTHASPHGLPKSRDGAVGGPREEAVVQRFLRMHEDLADRGCFSHRDDAERLMQLFPLLRSSESAARLRSDIHIACRDRTQPTITLSSTAGPQEGASESTVSRTCSSPWLP